MAPERARIPAVSAEIWLHYSAEASSLDGHTVTGMARVVNVGPGGVAIEAAADLIPGQRLRFRLDLGEGRSVSGVGAVAWASEARGGLRFVDVDEYARRVLGLWLQGNLPSLRDRTH